MSRVRIWIPESLEELRELSLPAGNLSGHFTVELIDAKTKAVKEIYEFDNIITNGGMDWFIGASDNIANFMNTNGAMELGSGGVTGLNAPAGGNTSLVSPLSPRSTNNDRTNLTGYVTGSVGGDYWYYRSSRLFTETQANGNITEMGFWTATTGGTLINRAAFVDATGTPITVTKTSTDEMRVWYEIRHYIPKGDITGSLTLLGSTYNFTFRPIGVNDANQWGQMINRFGIYGLNAQVAETNPLVDPTGSAINTGTGADTATNDTYINGSFKRVVTYVWNSTSANFGTGIGYFQCGIVNLNSTTNTTQWQCSFSPKIPKVTGKKLTLVVTNQFNRKP
jgi:hypothetical protein